MKRIQNGFTVIEGLLILVIVGIIGGTGWYVWHSQKQVDKTLGSAGQTSQKSTKTSQNKQSTGNNLFKFTNLGVQFTLPSSLSDFQYFPQTFSDGSVGGYISTTAIKNTIKGCNANQGMSDQDIDSASLSFAGIGKTKGKYDPNQLDESQLLKQFSSFYASISYPNGINPCHGDQNTGAEDKLKNAEHMASDTFIEAFQSTATEIE
jgi:hypothetical protein